MYKPEVLAPLAKHISIFTLISMLAACGGGTEEALNNLNQLLDNLNNNTTASQVALSGSVGDGPITGATVTIKAADGTVLASTISDINAGYEITVSDQADYPYIITAASGTDMVTGTRPDFTMVSVAMGPDDTTVNINPFTTLIIETAQAMPGGLTTANVDLANQIITEQLNFGLDLSQIPTPVTTPITANNVATIVKASEVLAEMVRRTHNALLITGQDINPDDILLAISSDMIDGHMDGHGGSEASPLIAATANIVSGEVLIEALSNNIKVNGAWATDLIDNAIFATEPNASAVSGDLSTNIEMLTQAEAAVAAAQVIAPSTALDEVAAIIAGLLPETDPADVETILSPDLSNTFTDAATLVVMSTDSQLEAVNSSANDTRKNAPPKVSFTADPSTVDFNGTAVLSWSSSNAVSCSAVEGWSITHAVSGSAKVGPLTVDTTFTLNCISANSKITTKSVAITVLPDNSGINPDQNGQLIVSNINPANYEWDTLEIGKLMFVDRDYVFADIDIPQGYIGMDMIRTSKTDRTSAGDGFVSFEVNIPVTVYIAHDDLITNKPTWLQSWTDTGNDLVSRSIFRKDFEAGTITLGGNTVDGLDTGSMYMILIEPSSSSPPSDSGINTSQDATLTLSWAPNSNDVNGYLVYFGATADNTPTLIADIPVTTAGFDPLLPSANFNVSGDLGLSPGNNGCFRVKAYNNAGQSSFSEAICKVV